MLFEFAVCICFQFMAVSSAFVAALYYFHCSSCSGWRLWYGVGGRFQAPFRHSIQCLVHSCGRCPRLQSFFVDASRNAEVEYPEHWRVLVIEAEDDVFYPLRLGCAVEDKCRAPATMCVMVKCYLCYWLWFGFWAVRHEHVTGKLLHDPLPMMQEKHC